MNAPDASARSPGRPPGWKTPIAVRRVLLADDSRVARSALRQLLENHSLEVVMAASAEEALELLSQTPHPDAVFMDHLMPGMSGMEATRLLRNDPHTAHIPVIMCTSRKSPAFTDEALQAGVYRIITKPASHESLHSTLEQLNRDLAAGTLPAPAPLNKPGIHPQNHDLPPPAKAPTPGEGGLHALLGDLLDEHHLHLRQAMEEVERRHRSQLEALKQHVRSAHSIDMETLQALQTDAMQQAHQISRDTAEEVAGQVIERYNAEHKNRWIHTCIAGLAFSLGIFALGIAWLSGAFS